MKHTYLEWYEPKRGDLLAHHFLNTADKGGENIDMVAAKANTSADWAGGGLVSTVEDLNCFSFEHCSPASSFRIGLRSMR